MDRITGGIVVLILMLFTAGVAGQEGRSGRRDPFSQPAKNLKVLKLEKPQDLHPITRAYNASLGVGCAFCHDTQDFAKDKPHKEMARKMIEMLERINHEVFTWEGAPRATCNMCHNGRVYPQFNPPMPAGQAETRAGDGTPSQPDMRSQH